MHFSGTAGSHEGNKKVGKFDLPTLARWQTSNSLPFLNTIGISGKAVKSAIPHGLWGLQAAGLRELAKIFAF
jgi:hypothetical protein